MNDTGDNTILLTGATGLVGRALAAHFFSRGYRCVLTARDGDRLDATARALGIEHFFVCDLSSTPSIQSLAGSLAQAGIVPRILINNAADVTSKPLMESNPEEIDSIIRVNVVAGLQLVRLLAPGMFGAGSGVVVNISSLAGYKPNPAQTVYSVSKSAVNAMSEALRAELRPRGIHVINVALMGVGEGQGRIPAGYVARRIERAINRREADVFFYRRTRWLMRLYGAFPRLMR